MKIVHPICCGMDIHKNIIVATIASTDSNGVTSYIQSSFSTFYSDVIKLRVGYFLTIAKSVVWNLQANIGFLFEIYWKIIFA